MPDLPAIPRRKSLAMHVLGQFIQEQMDARGWSQAETARRAGLAREQVSKLVRKDRLGKRLAPTTIQGLAEALELPESELERRMWQALNKPFDYVEEPTRPGPRPDAVLVEMLRRRLELGEKVITDAQFIAEIRERFRRG